MKQQPMLLWLVRLVFHSVILIKGNYNFVVSPEGSTVFIRDSDNDFEAVKQGDELQLVCEARSTPDNVFQWSLNGEIIEESSIITITTSMSDTLSNSTLIISSVNASEHKGNYSCQVTNNGGQANVTILVIGMLLSEYQNKVFSCTFS